MANVTSLFQHKPKKLYLSLTIDSAIYVQDDDREIYTLKRGILFGQAKITSVGGYFILKVVIEFSLVTAAF